MVARLPFLHRPLRPDEAGFLLVGQQWQPGGTSLYGSYWVDRPPLLVTIFRVASDLGGAVPLRLMGCLATVIVVLGCAYVARTVAGDRAAAWAAALAAAPAASVRSSAASRSTASCSPPRSSSAGIAAIVTAVHERREGRAALAAGLAGAATVAALLVKQNMADVGVFAAVVLLVGWRRGEVSGRRLRTSATSYAAGAVLAAGGDGRLDPAARDLPHGRLRRDVPVPDPGRATHGLLGHHHHATARMWTLLGSWVVSGGGVVMVAVAWALATRRLGGTVVWALVATVRLRRRVGRARRPTTGTTT